MEREWISLTSLFLEENLTSMIHSILQSYMCTKLYFMACTGGIVDPENISKTKMELWPRKDWITHQGAVLARSPGVPLRDGKRLITNSHYYLCMETQNRKKENIFI